jgi:drug/metabolite transporter (DMT)-like permease
MTSPSLESHHDRAALRTKFVLAFAILYLVWGSTYLAIRYAIETMPPILMVGTRFLAAGVLLFGWLMFRPRSDGGRRALPTRREWRRETLIALLLISAAYGLVAWAELTVPSGVVALLAGTTPLWMVVLPSFRNGRQRPTALALGGVALGILGQALLLAPGSLAGQTVNPLGAGAVVLASVAWAIGSLRTRRPPQPTDTLLASAMQMLVGGAALVLLGLLIGEGANLRLDAVSWRSFASWLYLVVAGSVVAYTAYVWLLGKTSPARVSTYAYVNPLVAIALGWFLAHEPVGARTLIASGLILVAVLAINLGSASH